MRIRKYYLAYDGKNLTAAFDGYEDFKSLKKLLNVCETSGYILKEVSEIEYEREKRIAEEKDLKELLR